MFRDIYKKANDDIKGDREILDRAFLQAAQPVKKKNPIIKYSFVGTAVAAVILIGAVFANPEVFTEKANEIKPFDTSVEPTQVSVDTAVDDDVPSVVQVEDTATDGKVATDRAIVPPAGETKAKSAVDMASKAGGGSTQAVNGIVEDTAVEEKAAVEEEAYDYGIALTSGDDDVAIGQDSEAIMTFTLGRKSAPEEADEDYDDALNIQTEIATEHATEEASECVTEAEVVEESDSEEVGAFSYMYDLTEYGEFAQKEGFKNTAVSPVTNREEAVERAKNECNVEYDMVVVYNDNVENIWKVSFGMTNTFGSAQDVYMSYDGITQMIVYSK